ncbi:hypothetical protein ACOJQI_20945 [Bacillus salacetis]|uniref:hypothetical protein n=1 Tax=Bacillus salacetis TaxID=2315464 RepID=UPI003B9F2FB9
MKKLKSLITDKEVKVGFYDGEQNISNYIFKSRNPGTELGKRLVFITLLRYAILDCLAIDEYEIEEGLTQSEIDYINGEIQNMLDYSEGYHHLEINSPKILYNQLADSPSKKINLDTNKCYIGYSGGKDSKLCLDLIKDDFAEVKKFKINFDEEEFKSEFHEKLEIVNSTYYQKVSTKFLYEESGKNYYQEEDLHCCFAAPYFSVKEMSPSHLSVGLQFDVINHYVYDDNGGLISEFGLTETYKSVKTFENLLKNYGLVNFKVIVPLASATSFAIYTILKSKFGEDGLRSFNSCWYPSEDDVACGVCMKCQRVSYIYKVIGMDLTPVERKSLTIFEESGHDLDFLFGSISCMKLLDGTTTGYRSGDVKNHLFIDEKIEDIDGGYSRKISDLFGLAIIENPLKEGVYHE